MVFTPLLTTLFSGNLNVKGRVPERLICACVVAGVSFISFSVLFSAGGMNVAFLVFLPVIYMAVRFGVGETAVGLAIVVLAVYGAHPQRETGVCIAAFTAASRS